MDATYRPGAESAHETHTGTSARERKLAMVGHLAALVGVVTSGIFLVEIMATAAAWLVNRDESSFVDEQGAEALNFQITINLLYLACIPLMFVFFIGIPLLISLKILNLVIVIVAAMQAKRGESFRYPFNLRFVKPVGEVRS